MQFLILESSFVQHAKLITKKLVWLVAPHSAGRRTWYLDLGKLSVRTFFENLPPSVSYAVVGSTDYDAIAKRTDSDVDVILPRESLPTFAARLTRVRPPRFVSFDLYTLAGEAGYSWRGCPYAPPQLLRSLIQSAELMSDGPKRGDRVLERKIIAFHLLYHKSTPYLATAKAMDKMREFGLLSDSELSLPANEIRVLLGQKFSALNHSETCISRGHKRWMRKSGIR